jgi:hypothetical protein
MCTLPAAWPCKASAHQTNSTARHGTAQHSTAQHSTAQHGTARHSTSHLGHQTGGACGQVEAPLELVSLATGNGLNRALQDEKPPVRPWVTERPAQQKAAGAGCRRMSNSKCKAENLNALQRKADRRRQACARLPQHACTRCSQDQVEKEDGDQAAKKG